eukprot:6191863-Pleurochrysis_carterae.AAC.3
MAQQRESFLQWGVMGDWNNAYHSMLPAFESGELGILRAMLRRGFIFRGQRPVHWSPASRTALAEAELEYQDDHISTAAYIGFELCSPPSGIGSPEGGAQNTFEAAASHDSVQTVPLPERMASRIASDERVLAVIWTTTPWTIPANQAVCAGSGIEYTLARGTSSQRCFLLASARLEAFSEAISEELTPLGTVDGPTLASLGCKHPISGRRVPLLLAEHVTATSGSGLVHTAPAHGAEDYEVGLAHSLSSVCPVDAAGARQCAQQCAQQCARQCLQDVNAKLNALCMRRARSCRHLH